ncbi:MAG TPA: Flp pilus assembly protein CpaB [Bryobacteraceae bacterium]|nr:Flp pilus assembly protein CpaB [Bryobacteraceae bacterium]
MDRQKMLMIFAGAWVSAALLTWFLYAQTKAPREEKTQRVVVAAHDMPSGTRLTKRDVRRVPLPEKDLPRGAISDEKLAIDHALIYPVAANETLTVLKVTSFAGVDGLPSSIQPGMRAISVPVTDSSGVAGLILPRAHVDVLFTRPGSLSEAVTSTILQDVIVLAIGHATEASSPSTVDRAMAHPAAQAATLLVTPLQARKLELAKNEGKISLALRNPLDRTQSADNEPTTAQSLELGRGRVPNMRDDKAWARLTGQDAKPKADPPKPRFVVDIYRGDKHVQEIFQ